MMWDKWTAAHAAFDAERSACVPDDQPDKALYDWHARALRKKAMADALRGTAIGQIVNREPDHRGEGIARAAERLNRPEVRMGCWGFLPGEE